MDDIKKLAGSMGGRHASKGALITTGTFSKDTRQWVPNHPLKIVLIDGVQLAEMMIDYDIGVKTAETFAVKKLDLGFFEEDEAEG